ncbi:glycoprotein X [Diaporthe helianthi]|uniref:Glycoprotein X n=1 Tax=Diaporthe helianthi TaxID=158607 RepID=A0A2P5HJ31_DIAHE|nr:glycoprotein X [Diaporthe helianthi]
MVSFYGPWVFAALGSGALAAAATYPNGTTSSICADWCWKTITETLTYAEPTTVYETVTETTGGPSYGSTSIVTSWRTTTVTAPGESSNHTLTSWQTSTVVSTEEKKTTEKTTETAYQNSTITATESTTTTVVSSYIVTTTNYVCSVASPMPYNALAVDDRTSTVYTTEFHTVTSCAPTVTGCPGSSAGGGYPTGGYPTYEPSPSVPTPSDEPPSATTIGCVGNTVTSWKTFTTEQIVPTTIPTTIATTIDHTTTRVSKTTETDTTTALTTTTLVSSYPYYVTVSVCSYAEPTYYALADPGTSTVYTTSYTTITSCPPVVTNCPGRTSSHPGSYQTAPPVGCSGSVETRWTTVTKTTAVPTTIPTTVTHDRTTTRDHTTTTTKERTVTQTSVTTCTETTTKTRLSTYTTTKVQPTTRTVDHTLTTTYWETTKITDVSTVIETTTYVTTSSVPYTTTETSYEPTSVPFTLTETTSIPTTVVSTSVTTYTTATTSIFVSTTIIPITYPVTVTDSTTIYTTETSTRETTLTTAFSYPVTSPYNPDRELHQDNECLGESGNIDSHIHDYIDRASIDAAWVRNYTHADSDGNDEPIRKLNNYHSHISSYQRFDCFKSNLTWSCAPGYNCNPPKPDGCNIWSDLPANNYQCPQEYCVPVKPYFNTTWQEGNTSYFPVTEGYFNLNPEAFGLSYDIFSEELIIEEIGGYEVTFTTGNWASQTSISELTVSTTATILPDSSSDAKPKRMFTSKKRVRGVSLGKRATVTSTVPAACFDVCNNCNLEAQSRGKVPGLCDSGSAFNNYLTGCNLCIDTYQDATKLSGRQYVDNQLSQWINYCRASDATEPSTSSAAAEVTSTSSVRTSSQVEASSQTTSIISRSSSSSGSSSSLASEPASESASTSSSLSGSASETSASETQTSTTGTSSALSSSETFASSGQSPTTGSSATGSAPANSGPSASSSEATTTASGTGETGGTSTTPYGTSTPGPTLSAAISLRSRGLTGLGRLVLPILASLLLV